MELPENELILFKRYIYLYFFLLLFEGALRRWFLPQFSDLLMVIRDPVALYLVFKALKNNVFSSNLYFYAILIETVISFFLTILIGHGNLLVALYGARILIIHFPLIFIIGSVFDSADVMKIGKLMIFLSIPMALLIIIQFYAPQTSFVNVGLAGNIEEVGFAGANGYYRPPGTFSFISGVNLFFGMASCFVFYALVNPIGIPKFWVYCCE